MPKDAVLREIAAVSFANIGQVLDDHGVPLPVSMLSPEVAAAIQTYEINGKRTIVRMHDKLKGLELAAKHLGLLNETSGTGLTVQVIVGTLSPGQLDPVLQAKGIQKGIETAESAETLDIPSKVE